MIELRKTIKFPPNYCADIWTVSARKWEKNGKVKEKVKCTCEEDRNFHKYFIDAPNLKWDNEKELEKQLQSILEATVKKYLDEQDCEKDVVTDYMEQFPLPIED